VRPRSIWLVASASACERVGLLAPRLHGGARKRGLEMFRRYPTGTLQAETIMTMTVAMRAILLAAMLVGCGDNTVGTEPDAGMGDAQERVCSRLNFEQSLSSRVGECCDESASILCAQGSGVCVVDMCVQQCGGHQPLCPNGEEPTWRDGREGKQCTCP